MNKFKKLRKKIFKGKKDRLSERKYKRLDNGTIVSTGLHKQYKEAKKTI